MTNITGWSRAEPEPTNLVLLWPADREPDEGDASAALVAALGEDAQRLGAAVPDEPDVPWTAGIRTPTLPRPITVWTEPARALPPDPGISATWTVGLETTLDATDPLGSYATLVRAAATAWPDAPALLDVNTAMWWSRPAIDSMFVTSPAEPPGDALWTIQAVEHAATSTFWLHTHGLWRCGRPELEMAEVPAVRVQTAALLVNEIASLLLDVEPPGLGEAWEIGPGQKVILQPWERVAERLDDGVPGSMDDRAGPDADAHSGLRVVVCGTADPMAWPSTVVASIEGGGAVIYRTERVTRRRTDLAQATWSRFVRAVGPAPATGVTAMVQAVFGSEGGDREHMWFTVTGLDDDGADGQLLNDPQHTPELRRGASYRITRDRVTDWQMIRAGDVLDPETELQP